MLPCIFVVDLHLYPHCLLFPKISKLLGSSSPTKLYVAIRHVTLGAVHQSLEACLVFWVIKVLIWASWIQPGTAQIAEVSFALCACHMVACFESVLLQT